MMFLRFVLDGLDQGSGRRQGLFQAAAELEEAGRLDPFEEVRLGELRSWFDENLEKPSSFSRSRRDHAANVALSWFRSTATAHVARMYELAHLLESNGLRVEVQRTRRPGYVVYEDAHQVTAEPYKETGA